MEKERETSFGSVHQTAPPGQFEPSCALAAADIDETVEDCIACDAFACSTISVVVDGAGKAAGGGAASVTIECSATCAAARRSRSEEVLVSCQQLFLETMCVPPSPGGSGVSPIA